MDTYGVCRHLSPSDAAACPICARDPAPNPSTPVPGFAPAPRRAERAAPEPPPAPPPPLGGLQRCLLAAACAVIPSALPGLFFLEPRAGIGGTAVAVAGPLFFCGSAFALAEWMQRSVFVRYLAFCLGSYLLELLAIPWLCTLWLPPMTEYGPVGRITFTMLLVASIPYGILSLLVAAFLHWLLERRARR